MSWNFDSAAAQTSPVLQAEAVARCAINKQPAPPKKPINLSRGWPNADLHPTRQLNDAADIALQDKSISTPGLQYGPDPGYQPLRESISTWLAGFYGAEDDPSRITITGGASQNLANVLAGFTDPNITKRIWMVTPTYYLASRIFEDAGYAGRLRAVPEDEFGLDAEYLGEEIEKLKDEEPRGPPTKTTLPWRKTYSHIIYCVPTFGNPSTKTMKTSRRRQLLVLAAKYNALIVTDDVYDFLQWPVKETLSASMIDPSAQKALAPRITDVERLHSPPFNDPDGFGFSISNGSFSKILGPGVRTGWVDCKPKLAFGLSKVGATMSGGAPSQITATFIDQMLRKRTLQTHIAKKLLPNYQQRHLVMMHAIKSALEPLGVRVLKESLPGRDVFGGYFVWITLPEGLNSDIVALACLQDFNLTVSQGSQFKVSGDDIYPQDEMLKPCIRLCFSYEAIEDIKEGIFRLAAVVDSQLKVLALGPMGHDEVSKMTQMVHSALDIGLPFIAHRQFVDNEKGENKERMRNIEKLLPPVGVWVREAHIRGFANEITKEEIEEVVKSVGEVEKMAWDARRVAWGESAGVEGRRMWEGVHAECGTAKSILAMVR